MTIREVTPNDASAIASIYNPFVTDTDISFETASLTISEMAQRIVEISSDFPYFVAEEDNRVVGFAYAHPWKVRAAYNPTLETTVYLAPEAQGKGIGRALMERLIAACRQSGAVSLIACITADNLQSVEFHKKLGFVQVSHFKKVGYKHDRYLDVVDLQILL